MGTTASEIENHIENQREDLSQNLQELQERVQSMTDWRQQFEARPLLFLGIAAGSGALLGLLTGGSSSGYRPSTSYSSGQESSRSSSAESSPAMEKAQHAWDNIKGALIGFAADRVKEYMDGFLPGFAEQYNKASFQQQRY